MNRNYAALLAAAVVATGLFCGGDARAQSIYVKVEAVALPFSSQDFYVFSVTNNLAGASRIYQFTAALDGVVFAIGAPPGFNLTDQTLVTWTDGDYNSAIAPGETGQFSALNYAGPIPSPSSDWTASVEGGPNGEMTEFFEGTVETNIPEPSTWAMMLIGFAGLGYAGCRVRRTRLPSPLV